MSHLYEVLGSNQRVLIYLLSPIKKARYRELFLYGGEGGIDVFDFTSKTPLRGFVASLLVQIA